MAKIYPMIMAGGIGSRLWPLSRKGFPKQFLPLTSDRSMLQDTVTRLNGAGYEPASVICNEQHRFLVAEHLRKSGAPCDKIILEAEGRGTAFTIAIAALAAQNESLDALILILPCDHYIEDPKGLHDAVKQGEEFASAGNLTVFGIPPTAPKTGYGYIEADGNTVKSFKEKPDEKTAKEYLEQGGYFWNAGIFLFPAETVLKRLKEFEPAVLKAAEESWRAVSKDLDFHRLPPEPLKDCPNISIDYAVLEKDDNVRVVPLETGWSDLGSWESVYAHMDKDAQGNAVDGEAILEDTQNSLIKAAQGLSVATIGLKNVAILADEDAVLVADLSKAESVAKIVKKLEEQGSSKHEEHRQVWRPWGSYKILGRGQRHLMKRLSINPGAALSLQYHNHRAEHWVVVRGEIKVQKDEEIRTLKANESIYIPIGAHHRIENESADETAELIEVQTGDYLEEDDIVRLEDIYKRI